MPKTPFSGTESAAVGRSTEIYLSDLTYAFFPIGLGHMANGISPSIVCGLATQRFVSFNHSLRGEELTRNGHKQV